MTQLLGRPWPKKYTRSPDRISCCPAAGACPAVGETLSTARITARTTPGTRVRRLVIAIDGTEVGAPCPVEESGLFFGMAVPRANSPRQVLFASLVGTTIEFFDFYIYGTAAVLVFPALFFP